MQEIIQTGLIFIQNIQQAQSPFLNILFQIFTFLGSKTFYIIFFSALLWCFNFRLGIRIGILFLVSVYFNTLLKTSLQQPRPFDLLPALQLSNAEGFGLPSGHSQSSILVWLSFAHEKKRQKLFLFALFLSFMIGFSRIYLGVHFPHDVICGWLIGGAIFYFYYFQIIPRLNSIEKIKFNYKLQILFIVTLLFAFILIFIENNDIIMVFGAITGAGWGLVVNHHFIHFEGDGGSIWQKIVRFCIGGSGIIFLYYALILMVSQTYMLKYELIYFIQYVLLGLWITAGAPWIFLKFRLVGGE